jgi:hypothetical protein
VESDPFKPTEAERGKAVLILQAAELALDGGAATVEVAAALSYAGSAGAGDRPDPSPRRPVSAVEGVRLSEDRLDLLAAGSAGPGCGGGVL